MNPRRGANITLCSFYAWMLKEENKEQNYERRLSRIQQGKGQSVGNVNTAKEKGKGSLWCQDLLLLY